jgi:hypothetical protein
VVCSRFEEKDTGKAERSRVYGRKGWICKSKGCGGWEMPRAQECQGNPCFGHSPGFRLSGLSGFSGFSGLSGFSGYPSG